MSPAKRSAKRTSTRSSTRAAKSTSTTRDAGTAATKPLAAYNAKRDFTLTKEPAGRAERRTGKQLAFVIQKHAASHLHFDLRLECDGVMKSWAVPKGPSLEPSVKRLAMEVEDHPIAYNTFEGTIPAGEYGGGTVMLWDRGTYTPDEVNVGESDEDAVRRGLAAGKLAFTFHGDRLHGSHALVRTRRGEERAQWLLLKHHDRYAKEGRDITAEMTTSVATKRTMEQIAAADNDALDAIEDAGAIDPMEATRVNGAVPEGEYAIEPALDGTRVIAFVANGTVQVVAPPRGRARKSTPVSLDDSPGVQRVLLRLARNRAAPLVLDGVLTDDANALVVVDLLLDGENMLNDEPYLERRARLEDALVNIDASSRSGVGAVRLNPWIASDASGIGDAARALGTHDVIAKRVDSAYESGPSKLWLQVRA